MWVYKTTPSPPSWVAYGCYFWLCLRVSPLIAFKDCSEWNSLLFTLNVGVPLLLHLHPLLLRTNDGPSMAYYYFSFITSRGGSFNGVNEKSLPLLFLGSIAIISPSWNVGLLFPPPPSSLTPKLFRSFPPLFTSSLHSVDGGSKAILISHPH